MTQLRYWQRRYGFVFAVGIFFLDAASAFIAPLNSVINEVVDLRSAAPQELVWRHRVFVPNQEPVQLDESIYCDRGNLSVHWRIGGQTILGQLSSKGYSIPSAGKIFPLRSALFAKMMCSTSAEEVREALLQERFIRREQLVQFKPEYQPSGDPNLWDTKANYILHDDISLKRLKSGTAIGVAGTEGDNPGRSVYFDRSSNNIARLEWRNGTDRIAWNFERFMATEGRGLFPRKASFEAMGSERVSSELILARAFSGKSANVYRAERLRVSSAVPNESLLTALSILLSYR